MCKTIPPSKSRQARKNEGWNIRTFFLASLLWKRDDAETSPENSHVSYSPSIQKKFQPLSFFSLASRFTKASVKNFLAILIVDSDSLESRNSVIKDEEIDF
ncbi:hypothetical protein TNIN_205681 [Trichonephila inaurata madagascariensis]|uniref:Uncharacterized protein n=1 Tax=Trichonephila inaurata madagascariensis TaxID=2747483 RepID=A0A8X7BX12_9ARAC|nr:hypothetical protein TNIN_205681 [Trichonephila inaurata madagascariensis]